MVLPSDDHVILRQWLATRGVDASELAGILVTGDLDALLAVAGSAPSGSPPRTGRRWPRRGRSRARTPMWPELGDLGTAACELRVTAVLERVCEALGQAGVPATPYEGLGVTWGHELLEAKLVLATSARCTSGCSAARRRTASEGATADRTPVHSPVPLECAVGQAVALGAPATLSDSADHLFGASIGAPRRSRPPHGIRRQRRAAASRA